MTLNAKRLPSLSWPPLRRPSSETTSAFIVILDGRVKPGHDKEGLYDQREAA